METPEIAAAISDDLLIALRGTINSTLKHYKQPRDSQTVDALVEQIADLIRPAFTELAQRYYGLVESLKPERRTDDMPIAGGR